MGIRDAIVGLLGGRISNEMITFEGPTVSEVLGLTPEELYRTQPQLQTVISFLARNVAHLGLPAYVRVSDTDRQRLRDDPLNLLLAQPNADMTGYELRESLISDIGLYDIAYWMWGEDSDSASGWFIRPIPPSWVVETRGGSAFSSAAYIVQNPDGTRVRVEAENMLVFHGWNPGRPKRGSAPVDALKSVLAEQIQAWEFRQQMWKRGGRVGTYLTRPAGSSAWSDDAREKFKRGWAQFTGSGAKAGSTPLLEDGMEMKRVGFSAREDQWLEASKLSLATVASIYHVNPVMVGILDNANFSNTKEFRKMLYSETLGPILAMVQDRLNTFLVPKVTKAENVYVEFNIQAKLQGDFEEQAAVLSSAVGAPWMLREEARARFNLPEVEGMGEPVIPLNVLIGGQSSPRDGVTAGGGGVTVVTGDDLKQRVEAAAALIRSGFDPAGSLVAVGLDPIQHLGLLPITVQRPTDPDGEVDEQLVDDISKSRDSAMKQINQGELLGIRAQQHDAEGVERKTTVAPVRAPGRFEEKAEQVLRSFFKRQGKVVISRLGAKAEPDWWDAARWDEELANDLYALAVATSKAVGIAALEAIGFGPDEYDVDRTLKFLRAVAESRAGAINAATRDRLKAALDDPDTSMTPAGVFEEAEQTRSVVAAITLITTLSAFAAIEAAKQNSTGATKRWVVSSGNPRPEHAAMDGETVPIDDAFSNGAKWPGDPVLGAEGNSNCLCGVEVTYP